MINGVGQNAAAASLARAGTYPRAKLASTEGVSSVSQINSLGGTSRKVDDTPQVGFGDNTLSGIGAALRTIGSGVESARRSVPSLEQIRAQQQMAQAEERIAAAQQQVVAQTTTDNTSNATLQAPPDTTKESQAVQTGLQTTTADKASLVNTTGKETFALYSRRSETSPDFSSVATTPKLDVKA